MRTAILFSSLFIAYAAHAQGSAFDLEPGTRVLAPVQFRQLTVFPVVQAAAVVDLTQYLTLSAGLKGKLVAVREMDKGGQVNKLHVENQSEKPLLLLGGEILLGGQQDRVLGKDTIIPAHGEAILEVFCVEHGRWSGKRDFTAAGGMAAGKIRMTAKYKANQGQVWDEVAKKTAGLKAETSTGTYRSVATGPEGEKAVKPYRDHVVAVIDKLPEAKQLIGVIAAVNGRITSMDVFATPALFAAYRDKLLDSIFASAADVPVVAGDGSKAPTPDAIRGFVNQAEAAPATQVDAQRDSKTFQKRSVGVVNSTVQPNAPKSKPVYKSYQAVE